MTSLRIALKASLNDLPVISEENQKHAKKKHQNSIGHKVANDDNNTHIPTVGKY
jgi:hypothetical protein